MLLKEAESILKPYGIIIRYDEVLKLYQVFFGVTFIYITEKQMEDFDVPEFKMYISNECMKDSIRNPYIRLQ
jgi:hypothetical protein